MADTRTETQTVNMAIEFGDGSQKTISQDDPITDKDTLISRINSLSNLIVEKQIFKSDNDANPTRIKSAQIVQKAKTKLDLTNDDDDD